MSWVLVITVVWLVIATLTAVLVGRTIRLADRTELADQPVLDEPNFAGSGRGLDALRADDGPPTIPGIPTARPAVGRPPAPPSNESASRNSRLA